MRIEMLSCFRSRPKLNNRNMASENVDVTEEEESPFLGYAWKVPKVNMKMSLMSITIGGAFLMSSIVMFVEGPSLLGSLVLYNMGIVAISEMNYGWQNPSVKPTLKVSVFHVSNPKDVTKGAEPQLLKKGPFMYQLDDNKKSNIKAW